MLVAFSEAKLEGERRANLPRLFPLVTPNMELDPGRRPGGYRESRRRLNVDLVSNASSI